MSSDANARRVILRVEDLHKSFGTNHVLQGVGFEVRRGELVAVVGPSGAGKTVLLELVIGTMRPDRGRVLVLADPEGELVDLADLEEDDLRALRARTGIVFQRDALYSTTVYENIALALREIQDLAEDEIGRRVRAALEAVGLPPDERLLAKQRDELSGGMAKRVAIARALATRPVAMAYDDPTAGLDPARAGEIHDLIERTHRTLGHKGLPQTTLVITHDKDLLRRFEPRVILLDGGRIRFDGPWAAFRASDAPEIRPYLDDPRAH